MVYFSMKKIKLVVVSHKGVGEIGRDHFVIKVFYDQLLRAKLFKSA